MSHPSRVRELKHVVYVLPLLLIVSHPSRVRELKHLYRNCDAGVHKVAPLPGA